MKTKTTRIVDPCGRVSIPSYLRELAGINSGDTVAVEVQQDSSIRISAIGDRCCICGEEQEGSELLKVPIGPVKHQFCIHCARAIATRVIK